MSYRGSSARRPAEPPASPAARTSLLVRASLQTPRLSFPRCVGTYIVGTLIDVADLRFEWDERKAAANRRKHGVSFEEARSVFFDEDALMIPDAEHSQEEARFILLGLCSRLRTLVVCHCYRGADEIIRIISARKANRDERMQYEERRAR
ncbi:MAG TPA: BrnT family toxin [Burkholderiales bacterium]|nr:BrnT family toxin [Burkholderiales bacterium]